MSAARVAAAIVAVLVVAAAIWRRRTLSRERLAIAAALAAGLALYASGLLSQLPDPKKVIGDVAEALGPWTYALVGVLAFLETGAFVGLVAPGETVVIAGGVIAGQGEIELIPLIGLVWLCAILGDSTSFLIGRRLGRDFILRHGPRLKITPERLRQVEDYFKRHGGKTILIGRFIGLVRALAPFIAGSSGFGYRRFIPYSVVGTGAWATTFSVLGFIFWQSFDQVAGIAGQAVFAFGITVAVIVGVVVAYRRLRDADERRRLARWVARQERRPLARPLFAVARPLWRRLLRPLVNAAAPPVRFIWQRLTPGELGIELTTSLAVAGVGIYVFVLYLVVLPAGRGATGVDREVADLAGRVRAGPAVDMLEVVTQLGSFPVAAALVVATCVALAARRRPVELVALVLGLGLLYAGVQLAKAGVDRPRPPAPLVATEGSSYPSGHAAYSTVWVAAAVVATSTLGIVRRAAVMLAALAVSAAVGLSRVYLNAHWLSDVAGGWGLGFGLFGLLAIAVLVAGHMRQNVAAEPARARVP